MSGLDLCTFKSFCKNLVSEPWSCFVFVDVERDVEFALTFVKSVRSMRADYQLTNKMKTECKKQSKL